MTIANPVRDQVEIARYARDQASRCRAPSPTAG